MEDEYLLLGYIIATHGLKGEVKIKSTTNFASLRYKKGNNVYLYNPKDDSYLKMIVVSHKGDNAFDYVTFEGFNDINLVEKFISYQVMVKKDEIPALPKDTYFFSDLCSCQCVDENGKVFGNVIKVEEFTAQLSLRVELLNKKTVLIPYVKYFVKHIDIDKKQITINVIPGLIEE